VRFDLTKFLLCRAIAENADADTPDADRVALVTSLMNVGLVQSAILTRVVAERQAPPTGSTLETISPRGRGRRGRFTAAGTSAARVKVPDLAKMSNADQIRRHLEEHRLQPRIHHATIPEIKASRMARQWPAADADVDEGAEIYVFLVEPDEGGPRDPPARK
jgi:hypothetical protein